MCLEESLYIHNIRDMKVLHTIRETPPNPAGERVGTRQSAFLRAVSERDFLLFLGSTDFKSIDLKASYRPSGSGLVTT